MKLLVKLILITSSLFLASLIMAHEGHKHAEQLDQASAIEAASIKMAELIQEGQLTSTWAQQEAMNAQLARVNGLQNWIVSYLDSAGKQRLELIFSMMGEFVSFTKIPISDTAAKEAGSGHFVLRQEESGQKYVPAF